ncbi:MAG: hypothetical protein IKB34_08535, partial [Clostridia bacterium]|nr:hypothetical protein [Clostridia bacterium]
GIINALGHEPSTAWSTDGEYHWKECTRCAGQQLEKDAHVDTNTNGKCDVCEYSMQEDNSSTSSESSNNSSNDSTIESTDKNANDGISTGAIIGIIIGSLVVVGLGGFAIFWFAIKKKSFADLIAVFKKK